MCHPRKVLSRVGVWGKVPEQCFHWPPQGTVKGNGLISDDAKFKKTFPGHLKQHRPLGEKYFCPEPSEWLY